MIQINAYLLFNGNCREALQFYHHCLGGELELISVGESPMAEQWPAHAQENILHGTLVNGHTRLLASDMGGPGDNIEGNTMYLSLSCSEPEETGRLFTALAAGGKVVRPLHRFFNGTIGVVTDKFGKTWMFYCA